MYRMYLILLVLLIAQVPSSESDHIEDDCREIHCPQPKLDCPADSKQNSTADEDEEDEDSIDFDVLFPSTKKELMSILNSKTFRRKREITWLKVRKCCPESQCVCKPCPAGPTCEKGKVGIMTEEGHGLPGSCCPKYECIPEMKCSAASQPRTSYWKNKCTKCFCFSGEELCEDLCEVKEDDSANNCFSEELNSPKMNGDEWTEAEGCRECKCINGFNQCQESFCRAVDCENPIKIRGRCCMVCPSTEAPKEIPTTIPDTVPTTPPPLVVVTSTTTRSDPEVFTENDETDGSTTTTSTAPNYWYPFSWDLRPMHVIWIATSFFFIIIIAITIKVVQRNQKKKKTKQMYSTIPSSESSQSSLA